jgi:hypothetical protein
MSKQSNDFQRLVKRIYNQIVPLGAKVTESAMVWDKSAETQREVDILVEYSYAGHPCNFVVECRDRSKKDSVEWIDGLIGKVRDLQVDKVIAVSSSGFSKSAQRKARAVNIETISMKDAEAIDWSKYKIRPAVLWFGDEEYTLHDVQVCTGDCFRSVTPAELEAQVYVQGEEAGSLKGLIERYFKKYLIPEIEKYKSKNMLEIFKTRDDLNKFLHVETEKHWPKICYLINQERNPLDRIKFIVYGKRQLFQGEQVHNQYMENAISSSTICDGEGNVCESLVVQNSETGEIKASLTKRKKEESA